MAKSVLNWNREMYDVDVLKATEFINEKEMRREYARLRKVAQKRLKRLSKRDLSRLQTYQKFKHAFDEPSTKLTKRDLPYALEDVATFLSRQSSTIRGAEKYIKENIKTLHKHKYTFVNRENFLDFVDFMERWREEDTDRMYDSTRAYELMREAARLDIDMEEISDNFMTYMDNLEQLKKMKKPETDETATADYFRKKFKTGKGQ